MASLLSLAVWGSPRGEGMALPTPLPQDRVAAAEEELRDLGAVDAEGRITARGRHLPRFPDPRLARALTDGAAIIGSRRCAEIAAMLGLEDGQVDLVGQWRQLRSGRHPEAAMWRREADRLARLINDVPLPTSPMTMPSPPSFPLLARGGSLAAEGWVLRRIYWPVARG